jgi:hypothetical protein
MEIVRMIKKEQVTSPTTTYFKTFCSLAAWTCYLDSFGQLFS